MARQTTKVTHRYCSNYRDLGMERKKEKIQIPNNIFLGKKNDMMNVIQNTNAYLYSGNSKFKLNKTNHETITRYGNYSSNIT